MQHLLYSQDGAISAVTYPLLLAHLSKPPPAPLLVSATVKQYLPLNRVTFMSMGIRVFHAT